MLILVAVTVTYGIKSGLLEKTLGSKEKYEIETEKEKIGSAIVGEETYTPEDVRNRIGVLKKILIK